MTDRIAPESLNPGDVIRLKFSTRGLGRKCVVQNKHVESATVSVIYHFFAQGKLSGDQFWASLPRAVSVEKLGMWDGELLPHAEGQITTNGEGQMATRTAKSAPKRGAKTNARKPAAKAAATNGGNRRSEAELDKVAAQVVKLRDVKGLSWADIGEQLDESPGTLRSLYNRGGGEPTGARSGSAAAEKPAAKRGRGKRPSK